MAFSLFFTFSLQSIYLNRDIQYEGTGGEQSGYKDREVDGGEQGDKESGKEANFYFPGLTPPLCLPLLLTPSSFDSLEINNAKKNIIRYQSCCKA